MASSQFEPFFKMLNVKSCKKKNGDKNCFQIWLAMQLAVQC